MLKLWMWVSSILSENIKGALLMGEKRKRLRNNIPLFTNYSTLNKKCIDIFTFYLGIMHGIAS